MRKKILVIEDEPGVLENITELLESEDYATLSAQNGQAGIELALHEIPDLIICDIMMPGLDGYGVIKQLHSHDITQEIPFIFLTAKSEKADQRLGMELGADDFLTKPFTPDELFNAIKARFEKKELTARQTQKKLEELKINLATSIPHELRTPLNGIIASSQYLMEYFELSDIDEIKQIHENIYKSARRLHNLILNYLLYAELEILYADKEKLKEFRRTQFASPLNVFTHIFKKAAIENERTYDLDLNIRSEAVPIQEDHLNKIAKELSANAFKFSDTGKVNVSTGIEDREFRISVTDHGRGMNQVQINKIGAYIQFDRKIYEQQGSGLGLAIVRRLADIYGGSFEIVSRPGEFTTINLGFPLK